MSLTFDEKVKVAQWIVANFNVDQERKVVRVPTAVEGEAVEIPLKDVMQTLSSAIVQAVRKGEDPWVYVANAKMTVPPTVGLKPCDNCPMPILRTLTPEEHFNQFVKRKAAEKLKIKFLDEVVEWLG